MFPDFSLLIESLNSAYLENLFFRLRQNKLISVYQLALLCVAYPGYAITIKHALSKNTVQEVSNMLARIRADATFSERDVMEGVYSVEEAIYYLIREDGEVQLFSYLREMQKLMFEMNARDAFCIKSFPEWIEELQSEGLLYKTLVKISEPMIALAFCDYRELFESVCGTFFSQRKLEDIRLLWKNNSTFDEKLRARAAIIASYRALRAKRKNWGGESFEYVIRGIGDSASFRRLLLAVGWFTLSTALKNAKRDVVARVLAALPNSAKYLIEDVIRGVVNPNILHDELQIAEARARCVRKALELYESGMIEIVM
jgi:hypothetical protein